MYISLLAFNKILRLASKQNWQYPRNKLIYIRELGEGQFGKVLLMKAQVIFTITCSISITLICQFLTVVDIASSTYRVLLATMKKFLLL